MKLRIWKESAVWVVRVEDAAANEPIQEYADRLLPVAFAMAERVHGTELLDVLAAKFPDMEAA